MVSISSISNVAIPAVQPLSRQAERSVTATENEKVVKQEPLIQRVNDNPEPESAEQLKLSEQQQKIEVAQQEAQRAEFDQQAGNVRNTEPNDVRPPSSEVIQLSQTQGSVSESSEESQTENTNNNRIQRDTDSSNKPAIDIFNQFQNINAAPRQGQELNQFV